MSKHESHENFAAATRSVFPALVPFSEPLAETAVQVGETYGQAWLEWQKALVGFTTRRLREDLDFRKSLVKTGNLTDVIKLQQDWATTTVRAYLDETSKLGEIISRVIHNGASSWSVTAQSHLAQGSQQGNGKSTPASIAAE